MSDERNRSLFERAAGQLGVAPLARLLKVPDGLLAAWISGHAAVPERKLLALTDLLEKLKDQQEPGTD